MKPKAARLDVRSALREGFARLRSAGVPSHTLAAELLLMHALGRDRTWIYAHPEEEISAADAEKFFAVISRRANGEPTQHLTGKQEFWGLEFEVTPDVLIPRPETEHVVEVALDRLAVRELRAGRRQPLNGEGVRIADVGTGSGCITIALAKALPRAAFFAMDISLDALEVARRNAERHGVSDRMYFYQSNLLEDLCVPRPGDRVVFDKTPQTPPTPIRRCDGLPDGNPLSFGIPQPTTSGRSPLHFDVIVSNPPYVGRREAATLMREVREHEPEIALYGGEEGYELYADLIMQSAKYLLPGGTLVLELGHNSLPAVQPLLDESRWTKVGVTNDLAGIARVLAAEKA
ncbi:MAG TPA: HemK/PrmC family methyltransferase [Candidatus Acidoferrum sp.]|nr:HemK/PrmC family methyltransferase [Candidatus Acidoferrum sp.]